MGFTGLEAEDVGGADAGLILGRPLMPLARPVAFGQGEHERKGRGVEADGCNDKQCIHGHVALLKPISWPL
jgi:hypothetical protein